MPYLKNDAMILTFQTDKGFCWRACNKTNQYYCIIKVREKELGLGVPVIHLVLAMLSLTWRWDVQLETTSRQFKLQTRIQIRKNGKETFGSLTEVVRTGDLSNRKKCGGKEEEEEQKQFGSHPEVCWCWRRKRERELTFIETKIRSGKRVEKTENGNDPGTVIAGNESLGSLECRQALCNT